MKPTVSVLMPAYNSATYIEKSILSIMNQSFENFELIICNDGSDDDTQRIINSFSDSRIKILHSVQNTGYVNTMNTLFENAAGKYVVLQDSDDYSSVDRLKILTEAFKQHPSYDIIGSHIIRVWPKGRLEYDKQETSPENIQCKFKDIEIPKITFGTLMMKAEVAKVPFRHLKHISRAQDIDWLFRASAQYQFMNVDEYLYFYRQHGQSMSNKIVCKNNFFFKEYITHIIRTERAKRINMLSDDNSIELDLYLENLIHEKKSTDPIFWERHLAYKAKRNGNIIEAMKWSCKGILQNPLHYGSYQCMKKILF